MTLEESERVDGLDFPAGTAVDLGYNFGFYRLSLQYDFFRAPDQDLAIGISAQIRNATIDFSSADGSLRRSTRNIGFVPIIKVEGRYTFDSGFFMGDGYTNNWLHTMSLSLGLNFR